MPNKSSLKHAHTTFFTESQILLRTVFWGMLYFLPHVTAISLLPAEI